MPQCKHDSRIYPPKKPAIWKLANKDARHSISSVIPITKPMITDTRITCGVAIDILVRNTNNKGNRIGSHVIIPRIILLLPKKWGCCCVLENNLTTGFRPPNTYTGKVKPQPIQYTENAIKYPGLKPIDDTSV